MYKQYEYKIQNIFSNQGIRYSFRLNHIFNNIKINSQVIANFIKITSYSLIDYS